MGKTKGNNTSTMGIKVVPLCGVIGAYKYIKSDWTMVAFVIPRSALKQDITEKELQYNGIYFLMGRDGITDKAYVGQAKKRNGGGSILVRLREHNDSKTEAYRDIWNYAVVVTSGNDDWGPTELNALENIFYNEIDSKNRLNGNEPNSGGYGDEVDYQEKVRQTKAFFKFSNMNVFKDVEQSEEIHMLEVEMPENYIMEDLQKGMSNIPEILTPIKVVKEMVDMLPAEVFNPDTRFLDMVCKGGEFLKEIYNRLMEAETMVALFPDPIMRAMHILDKQLFGVALSQESQDRANRNLYGYAEAKKNIKRIKNYISAVKGRNIGKKEDGSYITIEDLLKEEFGEDMEFNVVIGNPPYQSETKNIYQFFIESAMGLADTVCMITKNDFLRQSGLKDTREKMIDFGIESITEFSKVGDVFKIKTPVCSFMLRKGTKITHYKEVVDGQIVNEYKDKLEKSIIFSDMQIKNIISKIGIRKNNWGQLIKNATLYDITSAGNIGCHGTNYGVLPTSKEQTDSMDIGVVFKGKSGIWLEYTNKKYINAGKDCIDKYKIICGQTLGKNQTIVNNLLVIEPKKVSSGAFSTLYVSDNRMETENAYKYISSRLFRFLIHCKLHEGINAISTGMFEFIPIQDFSDSSDIDWSQSIPDIEKQLYKKYGLSQEEISYIESTIKPMS